MHGICTVKYFSAMQIFIYLAKAPIYCIGENFHGRKFSPSPAQKLFVEFIFTNMVKVTVSSIYYVLLSWIKIFASESKIGENFHLYGNTFKLCMIELPDNAHYSSPPVCNVCQDGTTG